MEKLRRKAPKGESLVLQMPSSREDRLAMLQDGLSSLACQLGLMAAQEMLQAELLWGFGPASVGLAYCPAGPADDGAVAA